MQKVRILGIAPYEGMCNLMKQIAKGRNDIELTAYVGDLEQGAEIASAYTSGDIDVILSRGGTAERIRELTSVPVVDIPLSVYDILRSIKLAENYNSPYAIIGFPAITKNAHFLCDVLRYTTEIYTIHTQEESKKRLEQLSQKGYNMVLCDMITKSLAQQFGISSILITSGSESVEAAIDQAVQVSQTYYQMTSQIRFFQTIIEEQDRDVFIYTDAGEQVYTSAHHTPHDAVLKKMQTNISLIAEEGQKRIYLEASGTMTILTGSKKIINDQIYILYSVSTRKSPLSLSKNGIQYINKEEAADRFFNSFYSTISPTFLAGRTIEQYAQGAQPLMILGEAGTYKEQMANLLYTNGNRSNSPLVAIDCARLHDKGRTFLVENDNSPFADSDITIHMKNMKSISDKQFEELLRFMKDAGVQERNRLLFTFPYSEIRGVEERCQSLINTFSCSAILRFFSSFFLRSFSRLSSSSATSL